MRGQCAAARVGVKTDTSRDAAPTNDQPLPNLGVGGLQLKTNLKGNMRGQRQRRTRSRLLRRLVQSDHTAVPDIGAAKFFKARLELLGGNCATGENKHETYD